MRFFVVFALLINYLSAHNLQHSVSYEEGVTITLSFAEEGDFSFQSYEVYAPDKKIPFQVGRTDVHARVIFLPDSSGKWRVKLFSEDGHGKIIEVDVDKSKKVSKVVQSSEAFSRALLGLLFLFGTFTLIYFIKRKKN